MGSMATNLATSTAQMSGPSTGTMATPPMGTIPGAGGMATAAMGAAGQQQAPSIASTGVTIPQSIAATSAQSIIFSQVTMNSGTTFKTFVYFYDMITSQL